MPDIRMIVVKREMDGDQPYLHLGHAYYGRDKDRGSYIKHSIGSKTMDELKQSETLLENMGRSTVTCLLRHEDDETDTSSTLFFYFGLYEKNTCMIVDQTRREQSPLSTSLERINLPSIWADDAAHMHAEIGKKILAHMSLDQDQIADLSYLDGMHKRYEFEPRDPAIEALLKDAPEPRASDIQTPIAERIFDAKDGTKVRLAISAPYQEQEDGSYKCLWQLIGLGDGKIRYGAGTDSMQALLTTLQMADIYIRTSKKQLFDFEDMMSIIPKAYKI